MEAAVDDRKFYYLIRLSYLFPDKIVLLQTCFTDIWSVALMYTLPVVSTKACHKKNNLKNISKISKVNYLALNKMGYCWQIINITK